MSYIRTLKLAQLPNHAMRRVRVGSQEVLLFRQGERTSAVSARCPHQNLLLPPREKDGVVTCPFHGAQFNLISGECLRQPLSSDWQSGVPLGLGRLAAAVLPKKVCGALPRYATRTVGEHIEVDCALQLGREYPDTGTNGESL